MSKPKTMRRQLFSILSFGIILLAFLNTGCSRNDPEDAAMSATVEQNESATAVAEPYIPRPVMYHNGDIITMTGSEPELAETVVQREGRIVFVGSKAEALERFGGNVEEVDLGGKTLLPGFIDAHGHLKNVGFQAMAGNLLPPPDSDVDSIAILQQKLVDWGETELSQQFGWIVGFGYDDGQLAEQRHPTRDDLDAVSRDRPVFVIHQSGHLYAVNSKLLELADITSETDDPPGGVIRRLEGSNEPNGVLEETALAPILKVLPKVGKAGQRRMVAEGISAYTRFGFTTATEGRAFPSDVELYIEMAESGELSIDVIAYPDYWLGREMIDGNPWLSRDYRGRFRIGGVKGNLDGSPQGKTAWLTQPYHKPPAGRDDSYTGYPMLEEEQALAMFDEAYAKGWQIVNHANGDAAIDQMIRAALAATEKYGPADRRTVGIHSQTIRPDQLTAYKELGIIPSFFGMHTFYWGDWHRDSVLGPERAGFISPAQAAIDLEMVFTQHHDAPVALPNSIVILATQVNRTTRSGRVLGPDQRVSVFDALRSITINAAYQFFEEDRKGTLEQGKLADFVILDANPLKVEPESLWNLKVLETIKEGVTVYKGE
jgi:predicted amidohydrolase YtcJ